MTSTQGLEGKDTYTSTDKPTMKTRFCSLIHWPWGAKEHLSSLGPRGGGLSSRDVHGNGVGSLSGEAGRGFEKALALDADHQGEGIREILHITHCRARPGDQNEKHKIHRKKYISRHGPMHAYVHTNRFHNTWSVNKISSLPVLITANS